nr:conjugal transfer protein [Legionella sp. 31fI33]
MCITLSIMKRQSLKEQIENKIALSKEQVFLRADFDNSKYDQVGRALLILTKEGKLIRVGYGLYAKARPNRLTGKPMFAAKGGFVQVAKEALTRLGVKWRLFPEYQENSPQIPVNAQFVVPSRFSRNIRTGNYRLLIVKKREY